MDGQCHRCNRPTTRKPLVSNAGFGRFGSNCLNSGQTHAWRVQSGRKSRNQQTVTEIAMNAKQNVRFTVLLAVSLALVPAGANAVGFRLPNQDPDAIARG